MIAKIALILIFGKPLVMYFGIVSLLSLLFTASIGYASLHGIKWVPFKYHPKMALTTIIIVSMHGLLGLGIYFNF
jgi:MFS superfamily sulfate permease-like transporter